MKYLNKKIVGFAVIATPIILLSALWFSMAHSLKGIDITRGWSETAE